MKASAGAASASRAANRAQRAPGQRANAERGEERHPHRGPRPTPRKTPKAISAAAASGRCRDAPGADPPTRVGGRGRTVTKVNAAATGTSLFAEHRITGPGRDRQQRGGAPDGGEPIARQRPHCRRRRRAPCRARSAPREVSDRVGVRLGRDLADAPRCRARVDQVSEDAEGGAVDERRRLESGRIRLSRGSRDAGTYQPDPATRRSAGRVRSRRPRARSSPAAEQHLAPSRTTTRQATRGPPRPPGRIGASGASRNGHCPCG